MRFIMHHAAVCQPNLDNSSKNVGSFPFLQSKNIKYIFMLSEMQYAIIRQMPLFLRKFNEKRMS